MAPRAAGQLVGGTVGAARGTGPGGQRRSDAVGHCDGVVSADDCDRSAAREVGGSTGSMFCLFLYVFAFLDAGVGSAYTAKASGVPGYSPWRRVATPKPYRAVVFARATRQCGRALAVYARGEVGGRASEVKLAPACVVGRTTGCDGSPARGELPVPTWADRPEAAWICHADRLRLCFAVRVVTGFRARFSGAAWLAHGSERLRNEDLARGTPGVRPERQRGDVPQSHVRERRRRHGRRDSRR